MRVIFVVVSGIGRRLCNFEYGSNGFFTGFFFKYRPLLDSFDKDGAANVFHRNFGTELACDPVLNMGKHASLLPGWN